MKYTRGLIALLTIVFTFFWLTLLLFKEIPKRNEAVVYLAAGFILGTGAGAIYGYYFATSKDKSDADQSKIFPKEPPNP